jgi:hypothetical protein
MLLPRAGPCLYNPTEFLNPHTSILEMDAACSCGKLVIMTTQSEELTSYNSLTYTYFLENEWRPGSAQAVYQLPTGWTTEGLEFESRWGQEFSLLHVVQTGSAVHSASYPMGTGGSFPWVKRPEREGDHSLSTSAEVKKTWVYTFTPLYAFMALYLFNYIQGQIYLLRVNILENS